MNRIKQLVTEAHRRSLWQVFGVYVAIAWGVYQIVKELTELFGLPDWVPGLGIVLLLIGLPIVLATAFVQEGAPRLRNDDPIDPTLIPMSATSAETSPALESRHDLFTWKKAVLGGICAFLLLGITAGGYMGLRNAGIGPFASLMSSGQLDEREPILIADFSPLNGDTMLATTITEAFRVDFAQSPNVTVVEPKHVRLVLQRMSREPKSRVDADLAHEIAVRDNIKTYLTGEVSQAGTKYVVSSKLIATRDGRVLATYRETADNADEIIAAVDRLSKKLRNKIGESLKTIRAEKPLELVSTPSLEALQKYTAGAYAIDVEADYDAGISLLEEAIQLDSAFAMAWRKLAVAYNNSGRGDELRARAIMKAYNFRDRLTDVERYSASGMYYYSLRQDYQKALSSYQMLMERDPKWPPNNLGIVYQLTRDYEKAAETFRKTIEVDSTLAQGYTNLIDSYLHLGKFDDAEETLEKLRKRFPNYPAAQGYAMFIASAQQDYAKADSILRVRPAVRPNPLVHARVNHSLADLANLHGRIAEGRKYRAIAVEAEVGRGNAFIPLLAETWQSRLAFSAEQNPKAALEILESALRKYPIDKLPVLDRPYIEVAANYAFLGQADRAAEYLQQYEQNVPVELRGNDAPARALIAGGLAFAQKKHTEAIAQMRKRDEWGSCRICMDYELGLAFEQAGMADSAIAHYEHFLNTPDSRRLWSDPYVMASTYERLADLYAARGDREKAARYAGKFVELWKNADAHLQPRVQAKREMLRQFGKT